jgi:uncharacterized protein YeaO (DUF488 family)
MPIGCASCARHATDCASTRPDTGNPTIPASDLRPVGITACPPRFPLGFKLHANLSDLAPTPGMLSQVRAGTMTEEQFRARYIARLDALGVDQVRDMLTTVQGEHPGVVLLCYEDVHAGETCHRRYLADWLKARLGLVVPELPDGSR